MVHPGDETTAGIALESAPPEMEVIGKVCWFWMLWAENGAAPVKVHLTEERAIQEAERLSRKVPGKRFYLMKGYRSFKCKGSPRRADILSDGALGRQGKTLDNGSV